MVTLPVLWTTGSVTDPSVVVEGSVDGGVLAPVEIDAGQMKSTVKIVHCGFKVLCIFF